LRVREAWASAKAYSEKHPSTCGARRLHELGATAMALAALAPACGGTPEKVYHPEPVVSSAAAPPAVTAEPPPAPAPPAPVAAAAPSPPSSPPSSADRAYVPGVACEARAAPLIAKGATLWAEPRGGSAVAGVAGPPAQRVVSALPGNGAGRIRVRTA